MKYISIEIDPKGRMPPRNIMMLGSMNQFFSGIGLGTELVRVGLSAWPRMFRPTIVPIIVSGIIRNRQMAATLIMVPNGIARDA